MGRAAMTLRTPKTSPTLAARGEAPARSRVPSSALSPPTPAPEPCAAPPRRRRGALRSPRGSTRDILRGPLDVPQRPLARGLRLVVRAARRWPKIRGILAAGMRRSTLAWVRSSRSESPRLASYGRKTMYGSIGRASRRSRLPSSPLSPPPILAVRPRTAAFRRRREGRRLRRESTLDFRQRLLGGAG